MSRIIREFILTQFHSDGPQVAEAYTDDGLVWRWASNDAPVPFDAADTYGIPIHRESQKLALQRYYDKVTADYRRAQSQRTPEQIAEERAMARAAHGPGRRIINVFTGEEFTT